AVRGSAMRKIVLGMAAATAVVASPAFARDGAFYIGADFGAMIVEDTDIDVGATEDAISIDHNYGYDGGIYAGYDLGAFRLEAEASYKRARVDGFTNVASLPASGGALPAGTRDGAGSTRSLSFMLNGLFDFGDENGTSAFVGGGAGFARVNFNDVRAFEDSGVFLDDRDSGFAWQVLAGVRQAISNSAD